jgi:uncharacterized protein YacL
LGEKTDPKGAALRGRLVEGVRLVFIALLATGGYQIGATRAPDTARILLFIFLGAMLGYVIGGVTGRITLRAVSGLEHQLRRTPAPQLAGGVVGLLVGLLVGALVMLPELIFLPRWVWPAFAILYMVVGWLGYKLGEAKHEDLFGLVGIKPRASVAIHGDL